MPLTDTAIRGSKPADRPFKIYDRDGLFLLINPSGSKLWRWRYRADGKEKLMPLGKYPDVTLARARESLENARSLRATGVDPMAQRKAQKITHKATSENSYQSIAGLWLKHWQVGKSPRHVRSERRNNIR